MSNQFDFDNWDDDDDDVEETPSNGPAELRKAFRKVQKELRDAKAQLADQGKTIRKRTITDAITAKGLNPKLAALVPSDIEPTEEAVTAWVEEFSDVFGVATPSSEGGSSQPEGQEANQSFYTEEELMQQGILSRTDSVKSEPGSMGSTLDKLKGAGSLEEIMRIAQGG